MGFTYLYTYVAVEEVPSKMLTPTSTNTPWYSVHGKLVVCRILLVIPTWLHSLGSASFL